MAGVHPTSAKPLAELAPKILDPVVRKRGLAQVDILKWWAEIAGPEFARQSVPDRIKWPRETGGAGAILIVACDPAIALDISYERDRIRERVNTYLGFPAIAKIRFVERELGKSEATKSDPKAVDPEQLAKISESLRPLEPALRESLMNLAEAVLARS